MASIYPVVLPCLLFPQGLQSSAQATCLLFPRYMLWDIDLRMPINTEQTTK